MKLSRDGTLFASANTDNNSTDLYQWDAPTAQFKLLTNLAKHDSEVTSVDISSDNKKVLTGSSDETVKVWAYNDQSAQYEEAQTLNDLKAGVTVVLFNKDATRVLVGGANGQILVYQYDTDGYKNPITIGNFENVLAIAIDDSGDTILASGSGADDLSRLWQWNADTKAYDLNDQNFTQGAVSAALNSQGTRIFITNANVVETYLYNTDNKTYDSTGDLSDHTDAIQSVVLSDDDNWLATAGNDQKLIIYQLNGTDYKKIAEKTSAAHPITQLSISGDGSLISVSYTPVQSAVSDVFFQYGIDCSDDIHSNTSRASQTSCVCKTRFVWNAQLSACSIDCQNDAHSSKVQVDFETCECLDNFAWDYPAFLCEVPCAEDPYSRGGNTDAETCGCQDGFFWNNTIYKCYFDCSKVDKSTGNYNATTCNCETKYEWRGDTWKCWVNCKEDPNSNGTNYNTTECFCKDNYRWDTKVSLCTYWQDCKKDPHSSG